MSLVFAHNHGYPFVKGGGGGGGEGGRGESLVMVSTDVQAGH